MAFGSAGAGRHDMWSLSAHPSSLWLLWLCLTALIALGNMSKIFDRMQKLLKVLPRKQQEDPFPPSGTKSMFCVK